MITLFAVIEAQLVGLPSNGRRYDRTKGPARKNQSANLNGKTQTTSSLETQDEIRNLPSEVTTPSEVYKIHMLAAIEAGRLPSNRRARPNASESSIPDTEIELNTFKNERIKPTIARDRPIQSVTARKRPNQPNAVRGRPIQPDVIRVIPKNQFESTSGTGRPETNQRNHSSVDESSIWDEVINIIQERLIDRQSAIGYSSRLQYGPPPDRERTDTIQRNCSIISETPFSDRDDEVALENEWINFKIQFNKTYPTATEEYLRKQNFFVNRNFVLQFNREYSLGLKTFTLRINAYADLLSGEFNQLLNGFRGGNTRMVEPYNQPISYIPSLNVKKPKRIDWTELGAVTSVKDQGKCASCHAFAAVGAVEGQVFRKTGILIDLSPQNLLDCLQKLELLNYGCKGGHVDEDFKYIWLNPGIDRDAAYPYEGVEGPCRFDESALGANITGYILLPEDDEEALEMVVATYGPVAVGVDAGQQSFQLYAGSVYYDPACSSRRERINHAMLLVGYDEEPDGEKYWLLKNSYGTSWGIGGYIKLARRRNNHCAIASSAAYPLV